MSGSDASYDDDDDEAGPGGGGSSKINKKKRSGIRTTADDIDDDDDDEDTNDNDNEEDANGEDEDEAQAGDEVVMDNNAEEDDDDDHAEEVATSLSKMTKIVNNLIARADSIPFREPVDWKGLELYDYPKIITKMMDLGTIRKNLKKSKYIDAYQCAQDIRQVWNNCMTYNEDGSDFYRLGQSYSKRFEERYQKLVDEFGENIVIPRQTTAATATATTKNTANDAGDDDNDDDAANEVDIISPEKNSNNKAGCGGGRSKSRSNSISTTGKNTPPPPTVKGGTSASKIDKLNNNTSNNRDDYSANGGSGSGTIVPLDVRTRFAARLQRLSGMELGHVLQVIDINCPEAIEDPTYDQLLTTTDAPHPASMLSHRYMWDEFDGGCQIEIDVDVIPVDTFWELDRYVKEKVNERGRGPWSDDLTTIADTAAAAATDVSNGGSASGGGGKKRKKSISSLEMVGK